MLAPAPQLAKPQPISWKVPWVYRIGALVGTAAGAYHGYKRNRSAGWAVGWALAAGAFWPIVLPIIAAQGFGERK